MQYTEFLDWKFLPDLILEQVFCYLPWRDRLAASCTCIPWNQTFYSPCLWKTFIYIPPSYLEKYSLRIYYDNATCNLARCFKNIGYSFQDLMIPPISDFFILNRALNVMSDFYCKQYKKYEISDEINPLCDYRSKLEHFSFEFANQIENGNTYGTGGTLLVSIKKVLDIISNLKSLRLKGLLLTAQDRTGLLEGFIKNNKESLIKLSLLDISKGLNLEYEVVHFTNLTELELTPFQICPDLLINLVQETKIETLILTQTRLTLFSEEFGTVEPIPMCVWELVSNLHPNLKVHQRYLFNNISEFIDLNTLSIIYQPRSELITRYTFTSNNISILDFNYLQYYHSLTEIVIIVDSATNSAVSHSIDEDLLWVVRSNPALNTLILGGERFSVYALTILFILTARCRNLKKLIIQSHTIEYNFQGISSELFNSSLSEDLITSSANHDLFRRAVSAHLKVPKWNLLTDEQFYRFVNKNNFIN